MTLNNSTSLAVAELIIYILLLPIILYVLYKHGRRGFMAYIYLVVFDIIRIVPAAMQISEHNQHKPESTTAAIIDSIGLSPLILCTAGILAEVRHYLYQTEQRPSKKSPLESLIHITTIVGVALSAYGAAELSDSGLTSSQISKYHSYQEAGSCLLFLGWILLVVSASRFIRDMSPSAGNSIFWLFIAAFFALVPLLIRTIYGMIYAFDRSPKVSPVIGYFAIRLILVFLMLFIAAVILIIGGLASRNISAEHPHLERAWPSQDSRNGLSNDSRPRAEKPVDNRPAFDPAGRLYAVQAVRYFNNRRRGDVERGGNA